MIQRSNTSLQLQQSILHLAHSFSVGTVELFIEIILKPLCGRKTKKSRKPQFFHYETLTWQKSRFVFLVLPAKTTVRDCKSFCCYNAQWGLGGLWRIEQEQSGHYSIRCRSAIMGWYKLSKEHGQLFVWIQEKCCSLEIAALCFCLYGDLCYWFLYSHQKQRLEKPIIAGTKCRDNPFVSAHHSYVKGFGPICTPSVAKFTNHPCHIQ